MTDFSGGSFQPGGSYPPPGATPPSQYAPGPLGPGQPGESSPWKYLTIGCVVVLILAAVALIGTCGYMVKKSDKLITGVLDMGKPEYMKMLTPDHTPEQRQEFSSHYDMLNDKLSEHGLFKFSSMYSEVFQEFGEIASDEKITVEESTSWIENFDEAMAGE